MPEPDFDQIARDLLRAFPLEVGAPETAVEWSRQELLEKLVDVWNARGAADRLRVEAAANVASESGYRSLQELDQAIRSLDR